ncbi:hypothetical protein LBC_03360 [Campylobacter sp. 19-13652]|nr:hypothetical protein LBC_03360 [Campylobacter sp. 19-13652]
MFNPLKAETVNAIAAIVDNEPITLFDVAQTKAKLNLTDAEALNLLIKDRLEQAQIKAMGLSTSQFEINERIAQLAGKNGMTPAQFRSFMAQKGVNAADLSEDVRNAILQEKLYRAIAAGSRSVSEERAKAYYEANKSEFEGYANVKVRVFRSTDARALEARINGENSLANVSVAEEDIAISGARPELVAVLMQTSDGAYTPIMRAPSGFEVMQVLSKYGRATLPFDSVKDALLTQMFNAERNKTLNDYFEKLRAKAKIEIIR